jgi:small-conductance mechanosensitive channel
VGVSYKSDPSDVRDALLDAAARHGLVKKRPEPTVFFQDYGASSIDFELGVWIDNPELIRQVRSDLRFIIWEELKRRHIEIPFPQRDLHIRSVAPSQSMEEYAVEPETLSN